MSIWIPLMEVRPQPNRFIRLKGYRRAEPHEEVISRRVYVDEDGLFSSSAEIQDTHWQYAESGTPS